MGVELGLSCQGGGGHRMRVFENRMSRKIFEPFCDGITGEWGRLHNEERHDLYTSPNFIQASK